MRPPTTEPIRKQTRKHQTIHNRPIFGLEQRFFLWSNLQEDDGGWRADMDGVTPLPTATDLTDDRVKKQLHSRDSRGCRDVAGRRDPDPDATKVSF